MLFCFLLLLFYLILIFLHLYGNMMILYNLGGDDMYNYVPIIDWKQGEQNALLKLNSLTKNEIVPLFIINLSGRTYKQKEKAFTRSNEELLKYGKERFEKSIIKAWENRQYYFSLSDDWYKEFSNGKYSYEIFKDFFEFTKKITGNKGIPTFNTSSFMDHHEQIINENNYFCLKIVTEDITRIEELTKLLSDSNLNESYIDLIVDLRYIGSNDLKFKLYNLEQICKSNEFISKFNKIIISSCSFPQSTDGLEQYKLLKFPRYEHQVHAKAKQLSQQYSFKYIYSDFGPLSITSIDYKPWIQSRFKMRYTTENENLFYIGYTQKKGGFDFSEISKACNILIKSDLYKGQDYSFGDDMIYKIAQKTVSKAGNTTSWITYSLNHHIELIEDYLKKEP